MKMIDTKYSSERVFGLEWVYAPLEILPSMTPWYVYVLQSTVDDDWYTGMTINLKKRIFSHNSKKNFSTKSRAPWKLIYYEASLHKRDAIAREKYLKSGMGKRYIKNRLKFFFSENF